MQNFVKIFDLAVRNYDAYTFVSNFSYKVKLNSVKRINSLKMKK